MINQHKKTITGFLSVFKAKWMFSVLIIILMTIALAVALIFTQKKFNARADNPLAKIINQATLTYLDSQGTQKTVLSNIVEVATDAPAQQTIPLQMADQFNTGWAIVSNTSERQLIVENDFKFIKSGVTGEKTWTEAVILGWIGAGYKWDTLHQGLDYLGCSDDPCWASSNVIEPGHSFWLELNTNGLSMKIPSNGAGFPQMVPLQVAGQFNRGWSMVGNTSDHQLTAEKNFTFTKDGVGGEENWFQATRDGWIGSGYKWDIINQKYSIFQCGNDSCSGDEYVIAPGQGFWIDFNTTGLTMKITP